MKTFALIVLVTIAFISCKNADSQEVSNSNLQIEAQATNAKIALTSENLLKDLTKKQKKQLDDRIPPKVREILDKADEINIYYNIDKDTKGLRVLQFKTVPNAGARLSDASLKKQFLESFYYDASSEERGAMCFAPRHKITAQYNNKTVDLDVCYQCSNFKGSSSSGDFAGSLAYENKSSMIISEIIEKYGTEFQ
jgi:beta-lactam-binding protein with PASTA domain